MARRLTLALLADFVPVGIVGIVILLFSFLFIRYYQHRHDNHLGTTVISSISLAVAVITCALIPADIFLVSFMKNSDGTFKNWANCTAVRESIENSVLYTYYVLCSCMLLILFAIIPLMYFYHEVDETTSCAAKCSTAFRNSLFFPVLLLVSFIIGAYAPFAGNPQQNATDVSSLYFSDVFDHHGASRVEAAFSFVLSLVSLFGMFTLVLYMGVGAGVYPVDLIKGYRRINREYAELLSERIIVRGQIQDFRHKAENAQLSSRERNRLEALEDDEELFSRRLHQLEVTETNLLMRCIHYTRPIQIAFGIFFVLVIFLVMFSMLMANIDRFLNSPGIKSGYLLTKYELPIIMDIIFVFLQKVYPLDYVFVFIIVAILFICAVGGINKIGIWFLWIRMYKVRAHKMKPQALLMLSFLLSYVALAVSIVIHEMAPQYVTYGSQHYVTNSITGDHKVVSCSTEAPPGECIMTQVATILFRFYYKLWFFGAAYFWLSWVFLLVLVISFIVAVVRKKRSPIEGEVEYDDLSEEEQPLLQNV